MDISTDNIDSWLNKTLHIIVIVCLNRFCRHYCYNRTSKLRCYITNFYDSQEIFPELFVLGAVDGEVAGAVDGDEEVGGGDEHGELRAPGERVAACAQLHSNRSGPAR